jgi:RNA polymerase subunit RPABC4/transcription elongation factor Spt4
MNCRKCGQPLDSKAQVCPFCGESVFNINKNENVIFEECAKSLTADQNSEIEPEIKYARKSRNGNGRRSKIKEAELETAASESTFPEEQYEKKKKWNPGPLIAGIFITIALAGAAAFAAYYAYNHFMGQSSTQYNESLQALNEEINKANDDFVTVLTSNQKELPVSELLKQTPKTYDSFNTIIKDYGNIIIPSVYSEPNKALGEAINLNKAVYQDLNNILKNPADPQTEQNLTQLSKRIDQCMSLYTSIGVEDVSFSLPNEIISISSKVKTWANQKQAEYAQITKLIDGFTKYFDNMINVFLKYDKAKSDFNMGLKNVRGSTATWDDLFAQLDNSENLLKETQADYSKMSVPTELKSLNKGFAPILEESLLYISKFRFAAQAERDFVKEGLTPEQITLKTEEINTMYQDAEKNNTNAMQTYQKYASDLNGAKTNYLDPEYVLKLKTKK